MNVLITGASKGIGAAISRLLATHELNLFLNARNEQDLAAFAADLSQQHPNIDVHYCAADLSTQEGCSILATQVKSQFQSLDVLVNNAGVFIPGLITEEEDGTLEQMMHTNVYSAYHLTRALIGNIKKAKQGHIFNMCSVASQMAYPNGGSYSISKFALYGFSKVLRAELQNQNVKVTSILPGATWSNSWAGSELPFERLMDANDVALSVWNAIQMSPSAVVEEIIMRPLLGDL